MNVFANHRPAAFTQLRDPKMDCPRRACDGWLNMYGNVRDKAPVYFQCSNKMNPNPRHRCSQPTMFSKRTSVCNVCNSPIAIKDIITSNWDHTWVHIRCAYEDTQPADVFAVCLRCNTTIEDMNDADPATSGGVEGYVHSRCAKKRRGGGGGSDETDTEGFGSQESQESV